MNFPIAIEKVLTFVCNNWTGILIGFAVLYLIYEKVVAFFKLSKEERIAAAKEMISQSILKKVADAEEDYENIKSAGAIKRAQVLDDIYLQYPILNKVADPEELTRWLDAKIEEALCRLTEVLKKEEN